MAEGKSRSPWKTTAISRPTGTSTSGFIRRSGTSYADLEFNAAVLASLSVDGLRLTRDEPAPVGSYPCFSSFVTDLGFALPCMLDVP